MRRRTHSASSLKTSDLCELKYYYTYEEKAPRIAEPGNALPFGTCVHYGLEVLFKLHKERQGTDYRFNSDDYEYVYREYIKETAKVGLSDISLIEEGWEIIKARMDNFDYSEVVLATESKFELETVGGTRFLGHIDKVVELSKDTIAVIDYKTSRTALTQSEADSDIQLSMYDLAVSLLWPKYSKIILVLDYLRLGHVFSFRTPLSRKMFLDWLDEKDNYLASKEPPDIKPTLNQFCGWCPFRQQCPEFSKAVESFSGKSFVMSELTEDEIIEEFDSLKNIYKAVDAARRDFNIKLTSLLKEGSSGCVEGSAKKLVRVQNSRAVYDLNKVRDFVPISDIPNICTINSSALERYLLDKPEVAEKIRSSASVSYNTPFFKITKK